MAEGEGQFISLRLVITALLVILLTSLTSFVVFTIMQAEGENENEQLAQAPSPGPIYEVDGFLVNLSNQRGRNYVRTSLVFELSERRLSSELEQREAQVRDRVITILRSKSVEDIENSAGLSELRKKIVSDLNEILQTGEITDVYFTEFVLQ